MIRIVTSLVLMVSFAAAQLCAPGCYQGFNNNNNCGGCGIRAFRLPPPMMAYGGGCGGGPCGQQLFQQPCGFGGCGGNNIGCGVSGGCGGMQQGIAYGIPDPIRTESGRIIRAPFLPPAAVAPTPIQQANLINYGK